jgi:hypothetical protein
VREGLRSSFAGGLANRSNRMLLFLVVPGMGGTRHKRSSLCSRQLVCGFNRQEA